MNINGLHITLGVNYNTDYNLSEVYRNNQNPAILPPVDWIQNIIPETINAICGGDLKGIVRSNNSIHPVIYVRSRLLWLMYLDYCLGDIDEQIQNELADLFPDGVA